MNQAFLIFLGSILTFLATILVEFIKHKVSRREKRHNFITLASQQLDAISKGFERLQTVLEFNNYFDYNVLDILERQTTSLETNQRESIYLESEKSKEQYINLVSDITMYVAEVRAIQQLYYKEQEKLQNPSGPQPFFADVPALTTYFNNQKNQRTVALVELKRRIQEYIRDMK